MKNKELIIKKLLLAKYMVNHDFSEEAYIEWVNTRDILNSILADLGWQEYEDWENDVDYNVVDIYCDVD